ncbi:hypothetical protein Poly21_26930 [Allorhodopirellula heiligendammensis]|uniref:Uncharacterized protein n=2 Tax=Allorhodopirellula heiligendammensis TaxID=2714739 RepID=A0A5C6BW88_9BACT|nr:hypothetical protein Poly21_26930 [Allorhodopirellula heiligendammensis]
MLAGEPHEARPAFLFQIQSQILSSFMKSYCGLLICMTLLSSTALPGCGGSGPTSVTEGVNQSDIDAYKQMEKELNAETAADFQEDQGRLP